MLMYRIFSSATAKYRYKMDCDYLNFSKNMVTCKSGDKILGKPEFVAELIMHSNCIP